MDQRLGFKQITADGKSLVCRLHKFSCGLKQASRTWFDKLMHYLLRKLDFTALRQIFIIYPASQWNQGFLDGVYRQHSDYGWNSQAIDLVIATNRRDNFKFSLKDLWHLNYFLGMEVQHAKDGHVLGQKKHILELLQNSDTLNAEPTPTLWSHRHCYQQRMVSTL